VPVTSMSAPSPRTVAALAHQECQSTPQAGQIASPLIMQTLRTPAFNIRLVT